MTTRSEMTVAERLVQVLDHLGLERAHIAASMMGDIAELAQAHSERIASLTLVCPPRVDPSPLRGLGSRLQIIVGDQGPPAAMARQAATSLPDAALVWLQNYVSPPWADAIADRTQAIDAALRNFLPPFDPMFTASEAPAPQGAVAGITYQSQGEGSPLLLLPLSLASSQWDPLLSDLSARHRTVVLGGAELGFLTILESRGQSPGYISVVRQVLEAAQLRPGETVLEAGSGSGVLVRWLAQHTAQANPIIGVDLNRYLLRESAALAAQAGLADVITFQEGNAEALPFPDNHVDVVASFTVMEEVDADRMLAEMIRVAKPGGRVAVMVRAMDVPWVVNAPLRPEMKSNAEIARGFVGPKGCADASLYRRFQQSGLAQVQMLPQLAYYEQPNTPIGLFLQAGILGALNAEETQEWHAAVAQAVAEGTYLIAQTHHCAIGTKL